MSSKFRQPRGGGGGSRGTHSGTQSSSRGNQSQHGNKQQQGNNRGSHSQQSNRGSHSQQSSQGGHSQQSGRGSHSQQSNRGSHSQQSNKGSHSQQSNRGSHSQQSNRGSQSQQSNRGSHSQQSNRGSHSNQSNRGSQSSQGSHSQSERGSRSQQSNRGSYSQQGSRGNQQSSRTSCTQQSNRRKYLQHSGQEKTTSKSSGVIPLKQNSGKAYSQQISKTKLAPRGSIKSNILNSYISNRSINFTQQSTNILQNIYICNNQKIGVSNQPSNAASLLQRSAVNHQTTVKLTQITKQLDILKNSIMGMHKNRNISNAKPRIVDSSKKNVAPKTPVKPQSKSTSCNTGSRVVSQTGICRAKNSRGVKPRGQPKKLTQKFARPNMFKPKPFIRAEPQSRLQQKENLLSFTRAPQAPICYANEDEDEMDFCAAAPQESSASEALFMSTSDDGGSDNSSDESEVSDQSSSSHISEYADLNSLARTESSAEKFISVYWDIENCPVPKNKSTIDLVKKIRDTFYEGRTEVTFTVVCDTKNLGEQIDRELSECQVNQIHAKSLSKNAADTKLQRLMMKFGQEYKLKNALVILISGDSDFSECVISMRYTNQIQVYVIGNKNTKHALRIAAHNFIEYEEFVEDLPSRSKEVQHILTITRIPVEVKKSYLKSFLTQKLIGINGRVKNIYSTRAELHFTNESACKKAFTRFEGMSICNSKVCVKQETRELNDAIESSVSLNRNSHVASFKVCKTKTHSSSKILTIQEESSLQISKKSTSLKYFDKADGCDGKLAELNKSCTKKATLYVFVSQKEGDVPFWTQEFRKMFSNDKAIVEWSESGLLGCFLIHFHSLSKAQKARKLLEINQKNNNDSPKFLKLIKGDQLAAGLGEDDLISKKIEESIYAIEKRKAKYLQLYESKRNVLRDAFERSKIGIRPGEISLVNSLYNVELEDQKLGFMRFTTQACEKLRSIDRSNSNVDAMIEYIMKDYSRECACFESGLPIYSKKQLILEKVRSHLIVLVHGQTASGKSTQLCQYLCREGFGHNGIIVCTQPRRSRAMMLAKHVNSQMGSSVASCELNFRNLSEKTKIVFTTDCALLNNLAEDPMLQNVSCIVIDEVQERTIFTDILLAMLKNLPHLRNEKRIVILSTYTKEVQKYQQYFDLPDEAVVNVSGCTFPVEVIWMDEDTALEENDLQKTIGVVTSLLDQNIGDIIAFLATPEEAERAMVKMCDSVMSLTQPVCIYAFHEKMKVEDLQKVFQKTPMNQRKVVFTTSFGETLAPISNIKYVIDCGMSSFSMNPEMNSINRFCSIGLITKTSADERKYRANRVPSGRCYRLYSQQKYDRDMKDSSTPGIRSENLSIAALKLLQLNVNNLFEFSYLEPPKTDSLNAAIVQLTRLGAIDKLSNKLTEFGCQAAKLDLDPRFCSFLLRCVQQDIGYEAAVIVVFATLSHDLFSKSHQNESDFNKMRFSSSVSDYCTYLEIYKEWLDVPKNKKSRWCVSNNIDSNTITFAHEAIRDLILQLSSDLNIKLAPKFSDGDKVISSIMKAAVISLADNLCIFSGDNQSGYLSPNFKESMFIHPLSSLSKKQPQYVVYDSVRKTTSAFLVNVTAVDEDTLQQVIRDGLVNVDLKNFQDLALHRCVFSQLGNYMLSSFYGPGGTQLKSLADALTETCDGRHCTVEVDFNKGELQIYVPSNYIDCVESMFSPIIDDLKTKLLQEESLINDFCGIHELTAVLVAGSTIYDVVLPGEYRNLIIKPEDCDIAMIVETLENFGEIASVRDTSRYKQVTFRSVLSAKTALKSLTGNEQFSLSIPKKEHTSQTDVFFKVLLSLVRRRCTGRVSFTILPNKSVTKAPCCLTFQYESKSYEIVVNKDFRFSIENLPENVSDTKLMAAILRSLPNDAKFKNFTIEREKSFSSNETEIKSIKSKILDIFEAYSSLDETMIDVKIPKLKDAYWEVLIRFRNPQDGQVAVNILNSLRSFQESELLRSIVEVKPVLEMSLFCSKEVFASIKDVMGDALQDLNKSVDECNELEIQAQNCEDDDENVVIYISSNNVFDMMKSSESIQCFVKGDTIQCSESDLHKELVTEKGEDFLREISSKVPDSHINVNKIRKTVTIYGNSSTIAKIKTMINQYLYDLEEQLLREESISLTAEVSGRSVIKEVIEQYELDLNGLCSSFGLKSAKICIYTQELSVTGSVQSVLQCQKFVEQALADHELLAENFDDDEDGCLCPVCCCKVIPPFHRLEYCGHLYCETCLLCMLQFAEETPILCCVEDCEEPLVVEDIEWATKKVESLREKIHSTSFETFMSLGEDVKFCPFPDCSMVYRVKDEDDGCGSPCSACQNLICTKCDVPFHAGMSCEFYQSFRNGNDSSSQAWFDSDPENRKPCPSCGSALEKMGKGYHIACWKCRVHICWRCQECFQSAPDLCAHVSTCTSVE